MSRISFITHMINSYCVVKIVCMICFITDSNGLGLYGSSLDSTIFFTDYNSKNSLDRDAPVMNPLLDDIHSASMPYLKTGTTIVGICCRDGVVLGADTRATSGAFVMDKNKLKIHTISPRIFCCAAGTSADCDQITRRAGHFLATLRIEKELAGMRPIMDSVTAASLSIADSIHNPSTGHRRPSSVFVLGGIDEDGPCLFEIDQDGSRSKVSFAALGSGSPHALAVLETLRYRWGPSHGATSTDGVEECGTQTEPVTVDVAVEAVRQAVQAGIINDLGSGSHVDLCVVRTDGVRRWREHMMVTRPPGTQQQQQQQSTYSDSTTSSVSNNTITITSNSSTGDGDGDGLQSTTTTTIEVDVDVSNSTVLDRDSEDQRHHQRSEGGEEDVYRDTTSTITNATARGITTGTTTGTGIGSDNGKDNDNDSLGDLLVSCQMKVKRIILSDHDLQSDNNNDNNDNDNDVRLEEVYELRGERGHSWGITVEAML